jgi:hypothetical protein
MAKMDTVLARSGALSEELFGLLHELRIALRAQLERSFPETSFTAGPVVHYPRVKDGESFAAGLKEADEAAHCIGSAGLDVLGAINAVNAEVTRITDLIARDGFAEWRASGGSWGCDDITVYRREAQYHLQRVFAFAATLHYAVQRTLWNVEFIHECAPHPCDGPGTPPAYPWYGRRAYTDGEGGQETQLHAAQQGRQDAERAARDAEAEWRVQSERAVAAEAEARQEKEARWAAERTLRETETWAKQADQSRFDAEQAAEEARRNEQAALSRVSELEEQMRQMERDRAAALGGVQARQADAQTAEVQADASAAGPEVSGRRRTAGRKGRTRSASK